MLQNYTPIPVSYSTAHQGGQATSRRAGWVACMAFVLVLRSPWSIGALRVRRQSPLQTGTLTCAAEDRLRRRLRQCRPSTEGNCSRASPAIQTPYSVSCECVGLIGPRWRHGATTEHSSSPWRGGLGTVGEVWVKIFAQPKCDPAECFCSIFLAARILLLAGLLQDSARGQLECPACSPGGVRARLHLAALTHLFR